MGGFDDHVGIMGDWMPPSPSPRTFFSAMLGDDGVPRSITAPNRENERRTLFPGHEEQIKSANTDDKNGGQRFISGDQANKVGAFSEQKMSSGGGLLERMAARAGFNAPRLNTESIRSTDLSQNPEVRSPYLTIPPGLSPTSLLDSPVFLTNSQVQPSPTTGKFPWALGGNSRSSTFTTEAADKSKDNFFENIDSSSFEFKPQSDFSRSSAEKDNGGDNISSEPSAFDTIGGSAEQSPPLNEQQDEVADHRGGGDPNLGGATSEDVYNWRKYGQKQVKGSEYPRSYYKCTHPNCPVKKKVERSHEGHITEIIYKGAHNHPKPQPNRRSALGSSNALIDMQVDISEQARTDANGDPVWTTMQKGNTGGTPDWRHGNFEVTSSAPMQAQNGTQFESGDAVDDSSTFSNDEDEDDHGTHGSVSLGYDGEGDESESKRRKIEAYATEMSGAARSIREPRVVVQTTSDVDILDDGYRWRKYGQKVVKGNPNPRSYYKCTSAGCTVRKHVERASHDLKSVITTYEGKHNHDVPAARNSSHGVSNSHPSQSANAAAVPNHIPRPEPSQVYNSMVRFERPPSFGLPGPSHGFSFGMNQAGLAHLAMSGFGPNQGKLPVLPVHPYLEQQPRTMNEMGFMLPKEPKMEPISESGLNLSNSSPVYHQIMSRLPLGPQM